MDRTLREMDRLYRKWIVPQGKEIVQQGNGLYIKEMDRTLWKYIVHQVNGSYIKRNGSYLQGTGSYSSECVLPQGKWIVTDGKESGPQSESQAPSRRITRVSLVSRARRVRTNMAVRKAVSVTTGSPSSLLYEEKTKIPKNRLNQVKSVK